MIGIREGLTPELREAIAEMAPILWPVFAVYQKDAIERAAVSMAQTCRLWGIYSGNKPIGWWSYRRGGDLGPNGPVHLVVHPDYHGRWLTRPVLRFMLSILFQEQDAVTVKIRGGKAWRLAEKFGFKLKEDLGATRLYEVRKADALPYRSPRRPRPVRKPNLRLVQ